MNTMLRTRCLPPLSKAGAILALASACAACGVVSPPVAPTAVPAPATAVPVAGVSRPGFDSRPIHTAPVTGDDRREIVLISVSIAPGASSPVHTHPGDCVGTVVDGQIELRITGREPRRVAAGEAFSNPGGTVHQFVNVGDKPVRLLTTLVVEKGKPRTLIQGESR